MTTETPTRPMRRRSSSRRRRLANATLIAAFLTACAGNDPATTEPGSDPTRSEVAVPIATGDIPGATDAPPAAVLTVEDSSTAEPGDVVVETRSEIGPRALDIEAAMMMVVDSIDVSGDDILVRLRVVNGSDQIFNVGVAHTWYGPLLEIRDNHDNTYRALAVEPAGVDSHSVSHMRFRLEGPFDPDAEEFTVELATNGGRLTTDLIAAPDGDVVRWWSTSPAVTFTDVVVSDQDNRSVQVLDVADRGTHLDVSIRASDASSAGFSIPDDVSATLTLADGTKLKPLQFERMETRQASQFTGVLRFLGTLPTGSRALSLNMAGIDVEIPLDCRDAACPARSPIEPRFAELPALPDLLHFMVKTEPLPTSTITIVPEG